MHGFKSGTATSLVATIDLGDELRVERRDRHWFVTGPTGDYGRLKWEAHKVATKDGSVIAYPDCGRLVMTWLEISKEGVVINGGGVVYPD